MRPGRWNRKVRRRMAVVAILLAAFGAAAAGSSIAMATDVIWGYPAER